MAKSTEYDFSKGNRKREIDKCKHCTGASTPKDFNLQGMCGTYCNNEIGGKPCMQVITWNRTGEPTTITRKQVVQITESSGIHANLDVTTKLIPGQSNIIQFGELKIN